MEFNVLYEGAFHFNGSKGSSSTFLYNGNGALICDASKGITHIDYDNNNNPIRIQFADGYASGISTYVNTGKHKGHSINNFYYQFYGK